MLRKKITVVRRPLWSPTPVDHLPPGSIISFDVGIINLAYCILSPSAQGGPSAPGGPSGPSAPRGEFTISDWNIINLADGDPKLTCQTRLKSGAMCGKKAALYHETPGAKNKAGCCALHGKGATGLLRNMTVDNVSEFELKKTLFQALDREPRLLRVERVLIEHQPLKAREKIKGIGHALFDYYVLRGFIDGQCQYKDLQFIDAKNKLTVYDGPAITCHLKTQYARNKWFSVEYCRWAIRQEAGLTRFFDGFKKQDDLADCFLQGAWYLKYGQHGTRGDITSNHQKQVYAANNALSYAKVRPRAASKKSLASGRLTLSNIKHALTRKPPVAITGALKSSIEFYFTTVEAFKEAVKG
jgi:hypothetical protein